MGCILEVLNEAGSLFLMSLVVVDFPVSATFEVSDMERMSLLISSLSCWVLTLLAVLASDGTS